MDNSHASSSSTDFCFFNKEKQVRFKMLIDYFDEKKTFSQNSFSKLQNQPLKSILKTKKKFDKELNMLREKNQLIHLLKSFDEEQIKNCNKKKNELFEKNKDIPQNSIIIDTTKIKLENDYKSESTLNEFEIFSTVNCKPEIIRDVNQNYLSTNLEKVSRKRKVCNLKIIILIFKFFY